MKYRPLSKLKRVFCVLVLAALTVGAASAYTATYEKGSSVGCAVAGKQLVQDWSQPSFGDEIVKVDAVSPVKSISSEKVPYDRLVDITIPQKIITETQAMTMENVSTWMSSATTGKWEMVTPLGICGNCSAITGNCSKVAVPYLADEWIGPVAFNSKLIPGKITTTWAWANVSSQAWANSTKEITTEKTDYSHLKDVTREGTRTRVYTVGVPFPTCPETCATPPAKCNTCDITPAKQASTCKWETGANGICGVQEGRSSLPCDDPNHRGPCNES